MAQAVVEVEFQGKQSSLIYTDPILSDLTRMTRNDYLQDPKAMWYGRLPALGEQEHQRANLPAVQLCHPHEPANALVPLVSQATVAPVHQCRPFAPLPD